MGMMLRRERSISHVAAEVAEVIATLPSVASMDWTDRAAAQMSALVPPCRVIVSMCSLDAEGGISDAEVAGIASRTSGRPVRTGVVPRALTDEDRVVQLTLRSRLQGCRSLGVCPPEGFFDGDGLPIVAGPAGCFEPSASAPHPDGTAGEPPMRRLWSGLGVDHVVIGLARLSRSHPDRVLVVMLGMFEPDGATFTNAPTPAESSALLQAVLPVLARRAVLALGISPSSDGAWLTQREQRVLELLTVGHSVREIAETLDRSPHTIHDHVKSLHRKLGASSRGELVARGLGRISRAEIERLDEEMTGFSVIPVGSVTPTGRPGFGDRTPPRAQSNGLSLHGRRVPGVGIPSRPAHSMAAQTG